MLAGFQWRPSRAMIERFGRWRAEPDFVVRLAGTSVEGRAGNIVLAAAIEVATLQSTDVRKMVAAR